VNILNRRLARSVALLALALLLAAPPAFAQPVPQYDVPGYIRRATWLDTLLTTRDALQRQQTANPAPASTPLPTFTSEILRGGEPARPVRVSVAGAKELYLYVLGAPEIVYGAADFAEYGWNRSGDKPQGKDLQLLYR
jgi:hypothetical protein